MLAVLESKRRCVNLTVRVRSHVAAQEVQRRRCWWVCSGRGAMPGTQHTGSHTHSSA